jgi:hypothetical protein
MFKNRIFIFAAFTILAVVTGFVFLSTLFAQKQGEQVSSTPALLFTPPQVPDKISFAGEQVPMENFDVRESLDRELLVFANFHSQTLLFLKKLPRYFTIIEPILKKNKIPEDFKYLALAESNFVDKALSPVGALGIWQFMKGAAMANGLEINNEVDERLNIEKATQAACNYLNDSYRRYRNWTMVAASYNAGMNGMDRQIEIQDSRNYYDLLLNEETGRYIFRILALKLVMSNPEKYGFRVEEKDKYPVIPTKTVEVKGPIANMVNFAHSQHINYKILKYFNPWLRQPELKNPKNKKYLIKIPEPGFREFSYEPGMDNPDLTKLQELETNSGKTNSTDTNYAN